MIEYLNQISSTLNTKGKTHLRLKIITNAPKNEFTELMVDEERTLKLRIKAKPENNKANKEIQKFLSKYFDCEVEIISGMTHSIKLVRLKKVHE